MTKQLPFKNLYQETYRCKFEYEEEEIDSFFDYYRFQNKKIKDDIDPGNILEIKNKKKFVSARIRVEWETFIDGDLNEKIKVVLGANGLEKQEKYSELEYNYINKYDKEIQVKFKCHIDDDAHMINV